MNVLYPNLYNSRSVLGEYSVFTPHRRTLDRMSGSCDSIFQFYRLQLDSGSETHCYNHKSFSGDTAVCHRSIHSETSRVFWFLRSPGSRCSPAVLHTTLGGARSLALVCWRSFAGLRLGGFRARPGLRPAPALPLRSPYPQLVAVLGHAVRDPGDHNLGVIRRTDDKVCSAQRRV